MATLTVVGKSIEAQIQAIRTDMLENSKFYQSLKQMVHPLDFAWCASLYHVSKEFVEVLRIRNNRFQEVEHEVFESHLQEELGHAEMLRNWMLELGHEDPENCVATVETENFISCLYRVSANMDAKMNLIVINALAEAFAFDFYCACRKHLESQGYENLLYWEVHTEYDAEHSNVFHLLGDLSEDEARYASNYVNYAAGLINRMLESWA